MDIRKKEDVVLVYKCDVDTNKETNISTTSEILPHLEDASDDDIF